MTSMVFTFQLSLSHFDLFLFVYGSKYKRTTTKRLGRKFEQLPSSASGYLVVDFYHQSDYGKLLESTRNVYIK